MTVIAVLNARRLGLSRTTQHKMAVVGLLVTLLTAEPHHVLMRAVGLLEAGNARSALAELEGVPDAHRWSDSRYWILVALARHALREYDEAIPAANWAISASPQDPDLYAIRFDAGRDASRSGEHSWDDSWSISTGNLKGQTI